MIKKLFGINKCCICKEVYHDSQIHQVSNYGMAVGQKTYYHLHCLKDVVNDPQSYTQKQVDNALKIIELIEYQEIEQKVFSSYAEKQRTKLRSYQGKVIKVIEL